MCLKTTPQYNLVEQFSIKKKQRTAHNTEHWFQAVTATII